MRLHLSKYPFLVIWAVIVFCLQVGLVDGAGTEKVDPVQNGHPVNQETSKIPFRFSDAVILGVIEGLTEFLPVSSTGHLILAKHLLNLERAIPVDSGLSTDLPVDYQKSHSMDGPESRYDALDAYLIIIQAGAILAVFVVYFDRLLTIARGLCGRDRSGVLLARNIIIAFLPAVVFGLSLEPLIDRYLFEVWPVLLALVLGAVLMLLVERGRKAKNNPAQAGPDLHEMTMRQAFIIGLCQCVALWPGTSRSMMAILGGYVVGLSPRRAAEFSFLLGLPTLGGAAIYKFWKAGPGLLGEIGWLNGLTGCFVAAVCAALAIRWLIGFLGKHGLQVFAWYRILLAMVVLVLLGWN